MRVVTRWQHLCDDGLQEWDPGGWANPVAPCLRAGQCWPPKAPRDCNYPISCRGSPWAPLSCRGGLSELCLSHPSPADPSRPRG